MDLYYYASCLFSHLSSIFSLPFFLFVSKENMSPSGWSRSLISSCLCFFVVYRFLCSSFSSLILFIVFFHRLIQRMNGSEEKKWKKYRGQEESGKKLTGKRTDRHKHEQNPLNTNELTRKEGCMQLQQRYWAIKTRIEENASRRRRVTETD